MGLASDGLRAGQSLRPRCGFLVLCGELLGLSCGLVAVSRVPLEPVWSYVGNGESPPPYGYVWR